MFYGISSHHKIAIVSEYDKKKGQRFVSKYHGIHFSRNLLLSIVAIKPRSIYVHVRSSPNYAESTSWLEPVIIKVHII